MAEENTSSVREFILTGLTDQPELQMPLFFLFLCFYMATVTGNLGLITLIGLNSHLHIPMYFFLFNLSFIDFSFSTAIVPKCWQASSQRRTSFPMQGVWLSSFSSVSLSFLNPTSCRRWHTTAMSPSVSHWCTRSPCLLRRVYSFCWGSMGWECLEQWLIWET